MSLSYPFGNPDAARHNPHDDALAGFVDIGSAYFSGADSNDLTDFLKTRFVVGPKGSGKTLYLRKIKACLHSADSVYVQDLPYLETSRILNLPTTTQIIRFSQCFNGNEVSEQWQRFWRSVIIITLSSHILSQKKLSEKLSTDSNLRLLKYIEKLYPHLINKDKHENVSVETADVYAIANLLMNVYNTHKNITDYLNKPEWDFAIQLLAEIANDLPPIYFFIDCIDDDYAHAPFYWMRFQKGLFISVCVF